MLTVDDARRTLGADCPMDDDEIGMMLMQLREIASIALNGALENAGTGTSDEVGVEGQ